MKCTVDWIPAWGARDLVIMWSRFQWRKQ